MADQTLLELPCLAWTELTGSGAPSYEIRAPQFLFEFSGSVGQELITTVQLPFEYQGGGLTLVFFYCAIGQWYCRAIFQVGVEL